VTNVRLLCLALAVVVALPGCTEGLRGVRTEMPSATGKPVASVTTSEAGGLIVLWNGESASHDEVLRKGGGGGWIAGSQGELEAVWKATVSGPPPRVDFARYVVLAELDQGGRCEPKIDGLDAEASGLLTLRYAPEPMRPCPAILVPVARILAVPRRVLTATVVFLEGYAYEVPDVPFG
jgi:hypothetical protein